MITSAAWRGKRYAVLGLARSGAAAVDALATSGARVVAWDANVEARDSLIERFRGRGSGDDGGVNNFWGGEGDGWSLPEGCIEIANLEMEDLAEFDALVVSPGVPLNRDFVAGNAKAEGTPIIGDIELFAQARAELPPHKVVGITGTNGKSTTTALVHHILQTAGVPSLMGGNIGLPILGVEPLPEGGVYVLELSSYQIDLTQSLDCDVAVLLNITPDHLDRYESFEAYAASKTRLFEMQSEDHAAVIAAEDEQTKALVKKLGAPAQAGTQTGLPPSREHKVVRVLSRFARGQADWPALRGPHNAQNASCAVAVSQTLGLPEETIAQALRTFAGLPHRMQRVGERGGVAFVDDSKATNPESVAPALAAFDRIHWILGGLAKSDDLDACRPHFGHVTRAYTIGEAGPRFAAMLRSAMAVDESGTLDVAVRSAAANAVAGDTVLLSPACASFDQFRDYEDRGNQFRAAVEALA